MQHVPDYMDTASRWLVLSGRSGAATEAHSANARASATADAEGAGFAEQDWCALVRPGAITAICVGKSAARFVQGRLLMHGADPDTPVTIIKGISHPQSRDFPARLKTLAEDMTKTGFPDPAVILLGLHPGQAQDALTTLNSLLKEHV